MDKSNIKVVSSEPKLLDSQNEAFNFFMEKLPNEMLAHIASYLNFEQLDILKQANERFGSICKVRLVQQYFALLKKHRKLLTILTDKFQRGPQFLKSPKCRIFFFQLNHCLKSPHDHCPTHVSGELLRVIFRLCEHFRSYKTDHRQLNLFILPAFWLTLEKSLLTRVGRWKNMETAMRKQKRAKMFSPAAFAFNVSSYFSVEEKEMEKVREKIPKF